MSLSSVVWASPFFSTSTYAYNLPKYHLQVHNVSGEDIPLSDALFRKCYPDTFPKLSRKMENHVDVIYGKPESKSMCVPEIREYWK